MTRRSGAATQLPTNEGPAFNRGSIVAAGYEYISLSHCRSGLQATNVADSISTRLPRSCSRSDQPDAHTYVTIASAPIDPCVPGKQRHSPPRRSEQRPTFGVGVEFRLKRLSSARGARRTIPSLGPKPACKSAVSDP